MKKLMVAMVSAASAIFAFGDLPHGADFEANGYVVGENFTNYLNKADDGVATVGARYWESSGEEIGSIATNELGGPVGVDVVPDYFTNAVSNGKYLQLDSGKTRLLRNIASDGTAVSMSTGDGIYLDTLVKFSAASSLLDSDFESGDKLAIAYVGELDDGNYLSNFVVRAGVVGSDVTNYVANVPDLLPKFDVNEWYRLTIRTIADIGGGRAGFKIYINGKPMVYLTDKDEFAKSAGFLDDTHTIFPSALEAGQTDADTITAVAFAGNGSIDDVVFTTETPKFIKDTESVVVTFTAGTGVTGISVQVGSAEPIVVDMDNREAILPPGTAAFTVNATIDGANGYSFVGMTVGSDEYNTNPANITNYAGGAIAITTTRNNFSLFDENGDPILGTYTTLGAALAAQGVAKIQLAYDYTVADWEDNFAGYTIDQNIVLDLNGKTINGGSSNNKCMFAVDLNYTLTVINGVESDNGKIVYGGTAGVFDGNEGDVILGSTSVTDYGLVVDGAVLGDRGYVTCIYRGKFLAALNSTEGNEFICDTDDESGIQVVDGDSETSLAGAYWVVTPQQIIGTYQVTVTPTANATYAVTGATSNDGDVWTVATAQTITITATPGSGYEYADTPTGWTAGQDGVITIEVSAAGTVAIPAPTASSSWPQPLEDTPAAVDTALEADGFSTAAGVVTNKVEYDALIAYVEEKTTASSPAGLTAAQKANAVLCYALQASAIPATEIVKEDVTIDAIETGDDGAVDLTVAIDGVTVGASVPAATLAKIVTAKGGVALGSMSTENVIVSGHAVETGKVKITVTPKADSPTSFFTSVIINK